MSNLVQLQNGSKSYGHKSLFIDATFAINEDEHVGVIGPNGAGKTTLFKILTGREELDSGEVVTSNQLTIGYLAQEDEWKIDMNLETFLEQECRTPIWELRKLGLKLGLNDQQFSSPISELSGGYRMRAQLLYIIGCEPNLMLLDEPTNYLDLESLLILERFLIDFRGAFLLISHDRHFLKRVTNYTLEIESGEINKYPGNIDDYFEQKELIREQALKQNLSAEAKKKKIMDFVNRFGAKATKARQAQSRLKQLEKIEFTSVRPLNAGPEIKIPDPIRTGKLVLEANDLQLGYGEKTVIEGLDMKVAKGDHIGVVGVNGAGKSTLLKGLAKIIEPQRGSVQVGFQASIGYFAQHSADQLKPTDTVYESLMFGAHPEVKPQQVRDMAGSLLFSNDAIDKTISVLSGGEKARVALGMILLSKTPVLLLDEPTNHLDFATVESLTTALERYSGTLIMVSHDRDFIGRVSKKIIEIRDGRASLYPGDYAAYLWSVEKGTFASHSTEKAVERTNLDEAPNAEKSKFNFKAETKSLEREIRILEKEAEKLDQRVRQNQESLVNISAEMTKNPNDILSLSTQAEDLQSSIDLDEYRWMKVVEELDGVKAKLKKIRD